MPNRIIKESICESEKLAECSFFAQDLYKRLITYADDYGRFNSDPIIMRARLYARELDCVSNEDILEALVELAGGGKIAFYTPDVFNQLGKKGVYGAFPHWSEHQRIRNSKKKCPEPGDCSVNDWYLRRFIPISLKEQVLEKYDYKCAICGKQITSSENAHRFIKMGTGLLHFDHIVPVLQGGRATLENLRPTCPSCNQSRKRIFNFDEILRETVKEQELATSCGGLRQGAADFGPIQSNPNPIQTESNPNPNPNPNPNQETENNPNQSLITNKSQETRVNYEQVNILFERLWKLYPKQVGKGQVTMEEKVAMFEIGFERVAKAIRAYRRECEESEREYKFIKNGSTFFNGAWRDYLPPAPPPRDPTKRYDEEGRELNSAGYPIIDFGLSKAGNDF